MDQLYRKFKCGVLDFYYRNVADYSGKENHRRWGKAEASHVLPVLKHCAHLLIIQSR
jgi:hypothetical protein